MSSQGRFDSEGNTTVKVSADMWLVEEHADLHASLPSFGNFQNCARLFFMVLFALIGFMAELVGRLLWCRLKYRKNYEMDFHEILCRLSQSPKDEGY